MYNLGKMVYDKYGILTDVSIQGSGSFSLTTGERLSIINARIILKSSIQSDVALTDNLGDDGNDAVSEDASTTQISSSVTETLPVSISESDTESDGGAGVELPGYDFRFTVISILSLIFIVKKKRY